MELKTINYFPTTVLKLFLFPNSQITVTSNYKDSKCDKIVSMLNNNPNSLLVSISSTLKSKCKGKKKKKSYFKKKSKKKFYLKKKVFLKVL